MNSACVITTINPPTEAIKKWEALFPHRTVVIGDEKTPRDWVCGDAHFYSIESQKKLPLESVPQTPEKHYARKNIGYLQAMLLRPECIYDTDDDNAPLESWKQRSESCAVRFVNKASCELGWCNIYHLLCNRTTHNFWPRGLPLNHIEDNAYVDDNIIVDEFPIQQGLADGSPDVDAIYRLVDGTRTGFGNYGSIALPDGVWSPFNSQSTWWFPEAYPLMYLPVTASFRMTDIWRSFVAQRCLWAMGKRVVFHSPSEADQDRNPHDLMADFSDEIPGYISNERMAECLMDLKLNPGNDLDTILENMWTCYEDLIARHFLQWTEEDSVKAWIADVKKIMG